MPPTEQVVVRASAPEDLVALVVHTLGFWPEESLVLVGLRGPRRRTGLVLRVDLEPFLALEPTALDDALDQVVAPLAADGAAIALLHSRSGGVRPAHRQLVAALEGALGRLHLRMEEAALVDGQRLFSLTCEGACCPPQGRALADVASTVVGAEMVALGRAPAADRGAAVARLLAGVAPEAPALRAEVAAHLAAGRGGEGGEAWSARPVATWCALVDEVAAAVGAPVPAGTGGRPPRTVDEAAAAVLDPARAAGLLGALGDVLVRDAVLVSAAPGARQVLAGSAFDPPGALAERVVLALDLFDRAPDAGEPELVEAASARLRRAARAAPDGVRARPLAVLAHWGWWRGSTVEATALAEAALVLDPGASLAALVLGLADHGVPPGWVGAAASADDRRAPRARRRRRRPGPGVP